MKKTFDAVDLEILNSKLISIVEESAATLLRTCYSAVVRDSRDFTCTIIDKTGQLLAQAPHSLPAFAATMPNTVKACLEVFPPEDMHEGDVIITNDPWIAIGHLNDVVIITPVFFEQELVAFAANAANVADIGGRLMGARNRSIYEEGIQIPVLKLYQKGVVNSSIIALIRQNVRMSDQVIGDINAQVAANNVCARRLIDFMSNNRIFDLTELASAIQNRSETAMRRAIREIPDGVYSHTSYTHGVDETIKIAVKITVKGDEIIVDYEGSSPQVPRSINSVLNYTFAYTAYAIKCAIAPHIPNNEGCVRPITVTAPENSIVNPSYPAPVAARSQTGKFLPIPVMRALAQAVPDRVIADSGSAPLWCSSFSLLDEESGDEITHIPMMTGGLGARPSKDGISAIDYPSVIVNVPVEIHEHRFPFLIRRWSLIPNSGGAGRYRGGLGFSLEIENVARNPMLTSLRVERTEHPAEGAEGGMSGSLGRVVKGDGTVLDPKKSYYLKTGERIIFNTAGGGGYGDPLQRNLENVLEDVREGWVTLDAAHNIYRVVINPVTLQIDEAKTHRLRSSGAG